jgi:site-specific DNA recombinase
MTIGAIYCRVSTTDQRDYGTSLETQLESCQRKAAELGWTVPQEYVVQEDWSGTDLSRPGLKQLYRLAELGHIQGVIIHVLDRLYRPEDDGDEWHIFEVLQRFQQAGVEVVQGNRI